MLLDRQPAPQRRDRRLDRQPSLAAAWLRRARWRRALTLRAAEKYAAGFKVSATWLLTGEGEKAPALTPDELALIQKYRQLSPEGKAAAHALERFRGGFGGNLV